MALPTGSFTASLSAVLSPAHLPAPTPSAPSAPPQGNRRHGLRSRAAHSLYPGTVSTRATERVINLFFAISESRRISRAQLARVIPDYTKAASPQALERMFERDKETLRELGVPVIVEQDLFDEDLYFYRIDTRAPSRWIDLTIEEYTLLHAASNAWSDERTGGQAQRIRAKLLSLGMEPDSDLLRLTPKGKLESLPVISPLFEAVTEGTAVSFTYRAASGQQALRRVEPWLLGQAHGHWYVYGYDRDRQAPRLFRASRIQSFPTALGKATAPREENLDLAALVAGRTGGEEPIHATVQVEPYKALELRDLSGAHPQDEEVHLSASAVSTLQRQVLAHSRWAVLQEPAEIRERIARSLQDIASLHEGAASLEEIDAAVPVPAPAKISVRARTEDSLSRAWSLASYVQHRGEVSIQELCDQFSTSRQQIMKDLGLLWCCGDLGYGGGGLIEVETGPDTVRVRNAEPLKRSLRLTSTEIVAVLAGLAVLAPATGELGTAMESVKAKLRAALQEDSGAEDALPSDKPLPSEKPLAAEGAVPATETPVEVGHGVSEARDRLYAVSEALRAAMAVTDDEDPRGWVSVRYSSPARHGTSVRRIRPLEVTTDGARAYVRAHCALVQDERQFRLDRIVELPSAETPMQADIPAEAPNDPQNETAMMDLSGRVDGSVWLRLAPTARWIAEAFGAEELREPAADNASDASTDPQMVQENSRMVPGTVLARLESPVCFAMVDAVLEAGGDAQVLSPSSLRDTIVSTARDAAARHRAGKALP